MHDATFGTIAPTTPVTPLGALAAAAAGRRSRRHDRAHRLLTTTACGPANRFRWGSQPGAVSQAARAFALSLSNSVCVMTPLSSRPLALLMSSAALGDAVAATDLTYSFWAFCMACACSIWR
jgi:hypothetical protein